VSALGISRECEKGSREKYAVEEEEAIDLDGWESE
jgi:hypothetical protein